MKNVRNIWWLCSNSNSNSKIFIIVLFEWVVFSSAWKFNLELMSTNLIKVVLVSVHEGDNSMLSLDLETYRQSNRNTLRFWWQFNNFGNCRRTFLMCTTILNIHILQASSLLAVQWIYFRFIFNLDCIIFDVS